MTTPLPILTDGSSWQPGTCFACHTTGLILHIPQAHAGEAQPGDEGHECCPKCCTELWTAMSQADTYTDGPTGWWPGVEADHPDWY